MGRQVKVTVNGKAYTREVEPRELLVHFIREGLSLTGTHVGLRHEQLRGPARSSWTVWRSNPARS